MNKHTQEPWEASGAEVIARVGGDLLIVAQPFRNGAEGPVLDHITTQYNAQRIAACVNACQGLETSSLRAVASMGGFAEQAPALNGLMRENAELQSLVEQLSAELGSFARCSSSEPTITIKVSTVRIASIRALLAKVKGGAA